MAIAVTDRTIMIKIFLSTLRMQLHEGKPDVVSFEAEIAYKCGIGS
jgi:hypothetical protein